MTNLRDKTIRLADERREFCPFNVWGYNTAEQRNAYYAQHFSNWVPWEIRQEKKCQLDLTDFEPAPGANEAFSASFEPPRQFTSIKLPQYLLASYRIPLDTGEVHNFWLEAGVVQ